MLVPMKVILDHALERKYGVGAYNVNNMEQVQGIMIAAAATKSPVVIQASRGALKYTNFVYLKHLMMAAVEDNPEIPVAVHLDHGDTFESCQKAIELGFTSVMIDGSLQDDHKTPSTYEENVKKTKEVVEYAHKFGVTVEGELGTIGGAEEDVQAREILLADPKEAQSFVEETGVDALAIAIGTSHGAYKFSKEPKLAYDVLKEIRKLMPTTPLVMHGSSSVPSDLIETINKYGGHMPNAKGVPVAAIQEAIKFGMTKINVDTDSRLAVTAAVRKVFTEQPEQFDPRKYMGPAREAMANLLKEKMKAFGTAGHAPEIKNKTLEDMKGEYS